MRKMFGVAGFPLINRNETKSFMSEIIEDLYNDLMSYPEGLPVYNKLDRSNQMEYDLLMKNISRGLPPIDNNSNGNKWDANYFQFRSEGNGKNYAKLFDCYMKVLGIK